MVMLVMIVECGLYGRFYNVVCWCRVGVLFDVLGRSGVYCWLVFSDVVWVIS